MKRTKSLLSLLVVLVLILGTVPMFTACDQQTPVDISADYLTFSPERQALIDAEDAGTLHIVVPHLNRFDPDHAMSWINRGVGRFERDQEIRVQYITTGWDIDEIMTRIIASIAARNPYDMMLATNSCYPLVYTRGLVQAIDDYIDIPELSRRTDRNDRPWIDMRTMESFYNFEGRNYVIVPWESVTPFYAFYNATMIERFDLDDPYELWRAGDWTIDRMHDLAYPATRDEHGTGTNNIWGLTHTYENIWQSMNHTSMVRQNPQTLDFELNFDERALIHSFEYVQDAFYARRFFNNTETEAHRTFIQGNHLFLLDTFHAIDQIMQTENLPFDWNAVPLPRGPHNEGMHTVAAQGFSLIAGTNHPHTAAALIEYLVQQRTLPAEIDREFQIEPHLLEMREIMMENPFYSAYYDSMLPNLGKMLIQHIRNGMDIAQAMEQIRPEFEHHLNRNNQPSEIPEGREHEDYFIDFEEENILNYIRIIHNAPAGANLSLATGADAIDGNQSLKIEFDTRDAASDPARLLVLDTDRWPLYAFNAYRISFDFRFVEEVTFAEDRHVVFSLAYGISREEEQTRSAGTQIMQVELTEQSGTASFNLSPFSRTGLEWSLAFGVGPNAQSIIIDNLRIERIGD